MDDFLDLARSVGVVIEQPSDDPLVDQLINVLTPVAFLAAGVLFALLGMSYYHGIY